MYLVICNGHTLAIFFSFVWNLFKKRAPLSGRQRLSNHKKMSYTDKSSIVVTGLKSGAHKNDITDALQSSMSEKLGRRHRDGKVDVDVTFPISSRRTDIAIATFSNKEAADRICGLKTFKVNGSEVTVYPKPPEPLVDLHGTIPSQFLKCLEGISGGKRDLMKSLEKTGVSCSSEGSEIVISSDNYLAFKEAQEYLEEFMVEHYLSQKAEEAEMTPKHRSSSDTKSTAYGRSTSKTHKPTRVGSYGSKSPIESGRPTTAEEAEMTPKHRSSSDTKSTAYGRSTSKTHKPTRVGSYGSKSPIESGRPTTAEEAEMTPKHRSSSDTKSTAYGHSTSKPTRVGSYGSKSPIESGGSTTEYESTKFDTKDVEMNEFTVNSDVFAYIKHVHGEELKEIEEKYNVKINKSATVEADSKIHMKFTGNSHQRKDMQTAQDKLIDLYKKHHHSIKRKSFTSTQSHVELLKAAAEAQMKHPSVFTTMKGNQIIFYAQSSKEVEAAENTVKRFLGMDASKSDSDGDDDEKEGGTDTVRAASGGKGGGRRHGSKHRTYWSSSNFTSPSDRGERESSKTEYTAGTSSDTDTISGFVEETYGKLQIITSMGIEIKVYKGDLTAEDTGAIVNAANENLQHIGGLALAIARKAGRDLQRESDDLVPRFGSIETGKVVYTDGYRLPCRHVIHAVGPRWSDYRDKGRCMACLQQTFLNCLKCADEDLRVKSIAIPAVSSGIYGVPKPVCAKMIFNAVAEFLNSPGEWRSLQEIRLVNIDSESTDLIKNEFRRRIIQRSGSS